MEVVRAFGIVRADLVGDDVAGWVTEMRGWAAGGGFELRGIAVVASEASFPLLVASFAGSGISTVVVPSLDHLGAWRAAVCAEADLWSLHPAGRLPRCSCAPRVPLHPLPFGSAGIHHGEAG
ncbi:hypothetical protein GZH49_12010 [Nocardia terpenica]|uniref:hypothetical protein n=1 Tax=Nocardia terpenica TaxID=455432 RepID=UPI002FDFA693